jgi:glutamyl-tRNA reductase
MSVSVVGISHRTAPLEVRERFAIPPGAGDPMLRHLVSAGCTEAVLLGTCNRTELYLTAPRDRVDASALGAHALSARSGMPAHEAGPYLYTLHDRSAVRHLFRVVSSLDSMVVGEAQIQGQVRDAYRQAVRIGTGTYSVGPVLGRMFEAALRVGARVRADTDLGAGAASIPSAAVALAREALGTLHGRKAVLLGAGETAGIALRCFHAEGADGVIVASRSEARAQELARRFGARAAGFEQLAELLAAADVVASATAAPHAVLTRQVVEAALAGRRGRPLLILDIAMPRDVEPAVAGLPGVRLVDLDELSRVVAGTLARRTSAIDAAERLIEGGADEFWSWYRARRAVPVIRALRQQAEEVRRRELARALGELSPAQAEALDRATRRLLAKLLHGPTTRLREAAANGAAEEVLEAARFLFSLDGGDGPDESDDEAQ